MLLAAVNNLNETIVKKAYEVKPLPDESIIDTNGAGDAFTGGFLAEII